MIFPAFFSKTSNKKQKVENKNLVYHTYMVFWTCKFFFQHLLRNDISRNIKWIFRQIQIKCVNWKIFDAVLFYSPQSTEHVSKSSIKGHIKVLEQNNKNCESYVLRPKVIFSLGPACGCVITLSSYNRSQIFASFSLGNVGNGKTGKSPWCLNPNTCEFNIFLSLVSVFPPQVWAELPQGCSAHCSF